jgi:putative endonuclease
MAEIHKTGKQGENIAVRYLRSKGYRILEQNWRYGKNEIDIIAEEGEYLVIVEVKTRHTNEFGEPETFVNRQKQRLLIRAANVYISYKNVQKETRFDIIGILLKNNKAKLKHIVDAFYPTL